MVVSGDMDLWSCCGDLHRFPQAPAWFLVSKLASLFIPLWRRESGGWALGQFACWTSKAASEEVGAESTMAAA